MLRQNGDAPRKLVAERVKKGSGKMKAALCTVLTILFLFVSMSDGYSGDRPARISTAAAIAIAKAEVRRRAMPLPKGTNVTVEDSFIEIEFRPPRPVFGVTFSHLDQKHRRSDLYQVTIDQKSGKIEDFLDMRSLITIPQ
jgi:hypothetical protein